jgi:N-acetylmuramic acid 6-phosphate etherase
MKHNRANLTTEKRNAISRNIDRLSTLQIVDVINTQDLLVAPAVRKTKKEIAAAVDMITERLRNGGRLFYVGAGTSGRLGVLDASECPPTYGVKRTLVQGIIAGGQRALVRSIEGAEDRVSEGQKVIEKKKVKAKDVVVGIAACGITPFVNAALRKARQIGAGTVFVTCAPEVARQLPADIIINPVVGPEVVTGSTRMKAGTATKLVLNTLTTSVMIKLGKVYDNLMVDLNATNAKLKDRSIRILTGITGLGRKQAQALLVKAHGRVKPAIVMHHRKTDFVGARKLLRQHHDSLRKVIERAV